MACTPYSKAQIHSSIRGTLSIAISDSCYFETATKVLCFNTVGWPLADKDNQPIKTSAISPQRFSSKTNGENTDENQI